MILIQLILVVGLGVILLIFLSNPRSLKVQAWKKLMGVAFLATAAVFIIFPDLANRVAQLVGVGRGADLLLYCLVLAFVFVSLSLYIQLKHEQTKIVKLARKIAILEANIRPGQKSTGSKR